MTVMSGELRYQLELFSVILQAEDIYAKSKYLWLVQSHAALKCKLIKGIYHRDPKKTRTVTYVKVLW